MKLLQALAMLGLALSCSAQAAPLDFDAKDFWQTPAIAGYGQMHPYPEGVYQPARDQVYKLLFVVTEGSDKPGERNSSLEAVARTYNLFVSAGVPADHLKFVAVISGPATAVVLDDSHYKAQLGVANPNLELIHKLRAAGVELTACAQAVVHKKYQPDWVNPDVKLALSALTTRAVLQAQGYSEIKL
ncbi:MAG: DsrE family protein [Nevskia sp.]|nr:DsrE family protein [Nevskia sp.]